MVFCVHSVKTMLAMKASTFQSVLNSKWKFRFFLFLRLPLAWFAGIRLKRFDEDMAAVQLRYRWRNTNPFNSIYFAAQAMAAELSTGVIVMNEILNSNRSISMLVVEMKSDFYKKAVGKIDFVCRDGITVSNAVSNALSTGDSVQFTVKSVGIDPSGDIVSSFSFVWSIKMRS